MMGHSITFRSTLSSVPAEIVNIIEKEYIDLESRFSRRDWSPGELNGARLAEAIFRYLEWKEAGRYTPIVKYPFYIPMINRHASQSGVLNCKLAG